MYSYIAGPTRSAVDKYQIDHVLHVIGTLGFGPVFFLLYSFRLKHLQTLTEQYHSLVVLTNLLECHEICC